MIERVGAAVARVFSEPDPDWDKIGRAPIEAMREPTAAMLAAGKSSISVPVADNTGSIGLNAEGAGIVWRAMIDAALSLEPNQREADIGERRISR